MFPDWFSENTLTYWTEALSNWSKAGVEFSGIWLDGNERRKLAAASTSEGQGTKTERWFKRGAIWAAQVLTHHMPYRMTAQGVGVSPDDVIWSNLNMNPYEARIRTAISWAITIGLIIVWAIPGASSPLAGFRGCY